MIATKRQKWKRNDYDKLNIDNHVDNGNDNDYNVIFYILKWMVIMKAKWIMIPRIM